MDDYERVATHGRNFARHLSFIVCRGVLWNYRWDPIRKRAMIGWEISACSPLRAGEPYRIQVNAAQRIARLVLSGVERIDNLVRANIVRLDVRDAA